MFLFYDTTFRNRGSSLRTIMTLQLICVVYSVLWLGFASPPACIAGVVVGACVAGVLHTSLVSVYSDGDLVARLTRLLEGHPGPNGNKNDTGLHSGENKS